MVFEIILGINIDTPCLIRSIQSKSKNEIIVLSYSHFGKPFKMNSVWHFSAHSVKKLIDEGEDIIFHKTLYGMPGMQGNMSSLYKNKGKEENL